MINILVIEDDANTRMLMNEILLEAKYVPLLSSNTEEALEILEHKKIDLIITDIMMPGVDGFLFTAQLRENGFDFPILMLTAKESIQDKRKGFIVGTDDYMVKPVDEEELLLRIKALLRRSKIVSERKILIGKVILYYDSFTVVRGEERITLPQKEFLLLYKLLSYPDIIFTRIQLMEEIWGYDSETDDHTVSVHIGRLRERFKQWTEFELVTVRGLGYKGVKYEE